MNVSEAVARSLVAEGASAVFSLLGDTNMEIVVRMAELGIPVHESRHEATAMAMADGYARASGKLAICAVTAGSAFAHTFAPMVSASRQPTSVIVLTGPHSRDDLTHRQALDNEGVTRLTGAYYRPIAGPGIAVERVRSVVDLVWSQRKPVVLDVPADIQAMDYPWDLDERPTPPWRRPQRVHGDPEAVQAAVELLQAAERPVLVAGAGATSPGAREQIIALAKQCGALLATTLNARGLFYGEPFDAGIAGLFASDAAAELFGQADCVVSFGASMNEKTTESGYLFPSAQFVQVDVRPPGPMDSGQAAECYVQGDAEVVAAAMQAALGDGFRCEGYRTDDVAKSLDVPVDSATFDVEPGKVDPRTVCAQLDELLPAECDVVSGAAHYWSWPIMYMPRWRHPLYSSYSGAIGYCVPVALGAALGTGRPVLAVEGDGGFMMYPNALETAALANVPLLVLVVNDEALGSEYHKLRAKGLDNALAEHRGRDLAGVAREMGCRAATLTDVGDLPGMVKEFLAGDGPFVIDARVSRNVISIPYRRTIFGIG